MGTLQMSDKTDKHGGIHMCTQNFSLRGGPDPQAIHNLCLILKIMF
jgi:hypothetical protein